MTPNDVFATSKEDLMDAPPVYQDLGTLTKRADDDDDDARSVASTTACSMQTNTSSLRRQAENGGGLHISQTILQQCPRSGALSCCGESWKPPPTPPAQQQHRQCAPDHVPRCIPLLDFLCSHLQCQPAQLADRLRHPQRKRDVVQLLRDAYLLTTHLKPQWGNIRVICHDLTTRGAALLPLTEVS